VRGQLPHGKIAGRPLQEWLRTRRGAVRASDRAAIQMADRAKIATRNCVAPLVMYAERKAKRPLPAPTEVKLPFKRSWLTHRGVQFLLRVFALDCHFCTPWNHASTSFFNRLS
jgi:hypothetical protein